MRRWIRLALVGLILVVGAPTATSAKKPAYRVMVNTRLRGGLALAPGDLVVCLIPGHWLSVNMPQPNASGVMHAVTEVLRPHALLRLTVTKNTLTGQAVISCIRRTR